MSAVTVSAQPASVDLESKVIGNQEQPRVMVIVPWQDEDFCSKKRECIPA